ncbi:hypothetical protein [Subtercola sp. YIM 133946]|uniref:hypothetical protein n=1 Tax=Subtercola sp. YIM 133946 TaxID=3118909 RepID=UPI002F9483A4
MAIDRSLALDEPAISALLRTDHTGFLRVGDTTRTLHGTTEGEALQALIQLIQDEASHIGRPVRVTVRARTGLSILLAAPDGSIEEESFVPFEELPQPWPPPETPEAESGEVEPVEAEEAEAEEPEAGESEPEHSDSDAVEAEEVEAEHSEPDAVEAEEVEPEHSEAEQSEPGAVEAEQSEPVADESEHSEPISDESEHSEPDAVEPEEFEQQAGEQEAGETLSSPVAAGRVIDSDVDDDDDEVISEQAPMPAPVSASPPAFEPEPEPEPEPAVAEPPLRAAPEPNSLATPAEPPGTPGTPAPPAREAQPHASTPQTPAPKAPMSAQTRRDLLDAPSFLAPTTVADPAQRGFAGFLNKFGFHRSPGPREKAERADIEGVSRHFDAHRTVSVINRKGGANKTPTVVNLAAVFARYGGGGVLAWDNNETMGTLGWRTEPGAHGSTVLDVLGNADDLLDARAEFGQMSSFVHHQQADKFDVLRSDEDPSGIHEMTADEVDIVHSIAAKYYRLIFMDSGNSDRAENWLRMIDHTDQLVVPTTTMEDRAQAALLTLQAVQSRSEKAADLARNAVVVVSEWQPKESSISQRMADDFRPYVRDVVIVPFDPALKAGRIQYDALNQATRRAWLAAAASVARGL